MFLMSRTSALRAIGQSIVLGGLLVGLAVTAAPGAFVVGHDKAVSTVAIDWGLTSASASRPVVVNNASSMGSGAFNGGGLGLAGGLGGDNFGGSLGGSLGGSGGGGFGPAPSTPGVETMSPAVKTAYEKAAASAQQTQPGCGLQWGVLAAIGQVASHHGTTDGRSVGSDGVLAPPLFGKSLDGAGGIPEVADTDKGSLDGDAEFDRTMGPMKLLPATWAEFGVDADGNGTKDVHNIADATSAVAAHLCQGGSDLSQESGLRKALSRFNALPVYTDTVVKLASQFSGGQAEVSPGVEAGGFGPGGSGAPDALGGGEPGGLGGPEAPAPTSGLTPAPGAQPTPEQPVVPTPTTAPIPQPTTPDPQPTTTTPTPSKPTKPKPTTPTPTPSESKTPKPTPSGTKTPTPTPTASKTPVPTPSETKTPKPTPEKPQPTETKPKAPEAPAASLPTSGPYPSGFSHP